MMRDSFSFGRAHLSFKLKEAKTVPGESIIVVGNLPALGNWNPIKGLLLKTDEESYPSWSVSTALRADRAAEGLEVEYKYVRDCRSTKKIFEWEVGGNRRISITSLDVEWEVQETGFGVPGGQLYSYPIELPSPVGGKAMQIIQTESDDEIHTPTSDISDCRGLINVPSTCSIGAGGGLQRLTSFSAMDQLIDDEEQKAQLRAQHEQEMPEQTTQRYVSQNLRTPIVIIASEMHPWSKTGGLAMIAGSYASEFALRGHRTMAIAPMYDNYTNVTCIGSKAIEIAGGVHEVRYFHQQKVLGASKKCDYIFIDHPCFHRREGIYGPPGGEYGDNLYRFALFSLAALEAPLILNIDGSTYGQDVFFIANDWQTGLVPVYLLYKFKFHGTYVNSRNIMVIHNIGYQGKFSKHKFPLDAYLGISKRLATEDTIFGDCLNLLAAGIKTADRVLTVSPNYALEIQTPEGGYGMHDLLRMRGAELRLGGILNGINDEWSPLTDPHIPQNYRLANVEEGKRICKATLQKDLGLEQDPNACLIGFCGRLCYQKGVSLIIGSLHWLMHEQPNRCQLILMGKGDHSFQEQFRDAENRNKGRVCGYVGFDPLIERRMMAGCDLLLMPSLYEPCGLPQMYAQAYGTLPVVHETGGLKDSVRGLIDEENDQDVATGWLFGERGGGFDEGSLKHQIQRAMSTYQHNRPLFRKMQMNAMKTDFYWPAAIDEYEKHVDWTMSTNPYRSPEAWWNNH